MDSIIWILIIVTIIFVIMGMMSQKKSNYQEAKYVTPSTFGLTRIITI